ncbi:SsgA family sporulation/cell division regulator [Streptomyces olivaceoviridis]
MPSVRPHPLQEFRFGSEAPLVVCTEFVIEGGRPVLWWVGRDLHEQALYSVSGLGDVRIRPSSYAAADGQDAGRWVPGPSRPSTALRPCSARRLVAESRRYPAVRATP